MAPPQKLRRKWPSRFGSLSDWLRIRRAIVGRDPARCGPRFGFRRTVSGSTASSAFRLTETALTGFPVLIGLFYMSGLYSGDTLPPGERLRAILLGTLAFVAMFFVVSGRVLRSEHLGSEHLARGRLPGSFDFSFWLLRPGAHAPPLIRAKLWGAPTAFAGTRAAVEPGLQLLAAIPELGLWPVGRIDELAGRSHPEIEFVVTQSKSDFSRISHANGFVARPPRVLLLRTKAGSAKDSFLGPGP